MYILGSFMVCKHYKEYLHYMKEFKNMGEYFHPRNRFRAYKHFGNFFFLKRTLPNVRNFGQIFNTGTFTGT